MRVKDIRKAQEKYDEYKKLIGEFARLRERVWIACQEINNITKHTHGSLKFIDEIYDKIKDQIEKLKNEQDEMEV